MPVPPRRRPGPVLSRDDQVGVAGRVAIGFHLRAVGRLEADARRGDVEAVHQLRVTTRRLRATLALFAPVLPTATVTAAEDGLAWVAGAIGAVRDLDVLSAAIAQGARRLDPALRPGLEPLVRDVAARRAEALKALASTLDARRGRQLLARLQALAGSTPTVRQRDPLGTQAAGLVRPFVRDLLRAGRRIDAEPTAERLHRLRVRGKRLRYALETVAAIGGRETRRAVRRLVRLQELLGEHQDAVTQLAWLREHAEGQPFETAFATGALAQVLGRRARQLRRRFPEHWARLDRRERWQGVADELAGVVVRDAGAERAP